jgi:hypothetical protein
LSSNRRIKKRPENHAPARELALISRGAVLEGVMAKKVKIFTDKDTDAVQAQVNKWLADNPKVRTTRSDIKVVQLPAPFKSEVTGKKVTKKIPAVAMSVWYEET